MRRTASLACGLLLAAGAATAQPAGFPANADASAQRAWIARNLADDGELIQLDNDVATFIPRDLTVTTNGRVFVTLTQVAMTRAAQMRLEAVKIESHVVIECQARTIQLDGDIRYGDNGEMVISEPRREGAPEPVAGGWAAGRGSALPDRRTWLTRS